MAAQAATRALCHEFTADIAGEAASTSKYQAKYQSVVTCAGGRLRGHDEIVRLRAGRIHPIALTLSP